MECAYYDDFCRANLVLAYRATALFEQFHYAFDPYLSEKSVVSGVFCVFWRVGPKCNLKTNLPVLQLAFQI